MTTMKSSLTWSSLSCLVSLVFLFQSSTSFVIQNNLSNFQNDQHLKRRSRVASSRQPQQERPVVVVGSSQAALGADLALSAFGILTGSQSESNNVSFMDSNAVVLYQHLTDLHSQFSCKPALHWTMDPGALPREIMTPGISDSISLLGIHLSTATETDTTFATAGNPTVSPELARRCTENVKEVLNWCNSPAVITLDLALHLSLLQAHCLPKSKKVIGDSYHVLLPEGGGVLVDYLYDENSFGSGTDPLCCQTREVLVSGAPPCQLSSAVSAGAYLALRNKGTNPIDSACIAASTAAQAHITPMGEQTESIAELCRHVRREGAKEAPGILRQKYKEFGYM